ncbi:MAG: hypothetical protein JSW11_01050 [Candidatus Heimdallarchaeota archaeon]|nr:MAG: hypothetical protein JSW11_01050 [Candidatus Heimdallarchaeota archaeon]
MRFKSVVIICFLIIMIVLLSGCTEPEISQETELMVLGVNGETREYTLKDIKELTSISGTSEYQNSYGNWCDKGSYRGVPISVFAEEIGGIQQGDILIVTSDDNYTQIFTYDNVYPSTKWQEIQGTMILAYEFNGTQFPDWDVGLKIAFIPPDGQYSNEDSISTSSLESKTAGSLKWSKWVVKLEFRRESETVTFGYDSMNYTLSWSQVLKLPSVNETGRYLTRFGEVSESYFYTGINLTYVVDLLIDIDQTFTVEIVASDGYARTFYRDQFFGNTTLYDTSGNEIGHGGPENVSLILAYYNGSQKLELDLGSFRAAYVGPSSPITASRYWVSSVIFVKISVG